MKRPQDHPFSYLPEAGERGLAVLPLEFCQHVLDVGEEGFFGRREGGDGVADNGCFIKYEAEFQVADGGQEVP